jgi:hypothetical protein
MRKPMPLLVAAVLSVLLSGCFTSQTPKFPMSSAVPALGDGGRYVLFNHVGKGKFKRDRVVTVKRLPDGAYEFTPDKPEKSGKSRTPQLSFHDIGNGVIIAQAKSQEDNAHPYAYLFVMQKGKELLLDLPQCDKQPGTVLEANGVVFRDKWECSIEKVADPAKLFAALTPGEPDIKLAPE